MPVKGAGIPCEEAAQTWTSRLKSHLLCQRQTHFAVWTRCAEICACSPPLSSSELKLKLGPGHLIHEFPDGSHET